MKTQANYAFIYRGFFVKKIEIIFSKVPLGDTLGCQNTDANVRGGENMKSTTERRQEMLEYLCIYRHESIANLMTRFKISRMTVIRDVQILSCSYPIYTTKGNGGGIHVEEGFRLGKKYLTIKQATLLEKLALTLEGEELLTIKQILLTFRKPISD